MPKKHFKNFDGLRFFAALFVVINHTESIKDYFHLPSLHAYLFFQESGSLAVKFFFVLSGFSYHVFIAGRKGNKGENIAKYQLTQILQKPYSEDLAALLFPPHVSFLYSAVYTLISA